MSHNLAICPVCGGNEIEREECVNCGTPLSRFIERPKQHGGARYHPPGREGGRPRKSESEKVKHWSKRPLIAFPQTKEQGYALEWWASLTPAKRLEIITKVFNQ